MQPDNSGRNRRRCRKYARKAAEKGKKCAPPAGGFCAIGNAVSYYGTKRERPPIQANADKETSKMN